MSAIEQVRAHFNTLKVREIEVPEWAAEDGQPLVVYSQPMTLADKQKISTYAERGRMEALAQTLILKARDAEGKPMFTIADKHALMHKADPGVLERIVGEMVRPPEIEDLEKN